MFKAPRLVTLNIELLYAPTSDEQAVFDGSDEDAQVSADQAVLRSAVDLFEGVGINSSRFRLGKMSGTTAAHGSTVPPPERG
jgi:hypothetical protein